MYEHLYEGLLLQEGNVRETSDGGVELRRHARGGGRGEDGIYVQNVLALERREQIVHHAHKYGTVLGIVNGLGAELNSRRVVRHVAIFGGGDEKEVAKVTELVVAAKLEEIAAVWLRLVLERKLCEAVGVPPSGLEPRALW